LFRGDAVAVLVKIICPDGEFAVLTEQPRIALGHLKALELPAGMMDSSNNFACKLKLDIISYCCGRTGRRMWYRDRL
jgi:hypothetical protein